MTHKTNTLGHLESLIRGHAAPAAARAVREAGYSVPDNTGLRVYQDNLWEDHFPFLTRLDKSMAVKATAALVEQGLAFVVGSHHEGVTRLSLTKQSAEFIKGFEPEDSPQVLRPLTPILAAHRLNEADASCSCEEMYYDTRTSVEVLRHEHDLHVEKELFDFMEGVKK